MSLTIVNYMQIFWSDLAYFVFLIRWLECMPDVRHENRVLHRNAFTAYDRPAMAIR
jgi:hypothetical protein